MKQLPPNAPAVIDELGDIEKKLKPYDDLKARRDVLRAQVLEIVSASTLAPENKMMIEGERYSAQISAAKMERSFTSMTKVYEAVGVRKFLANCSFTMTAAKQLLSGQKLKTLIVEERTGARTISTVPRMVRKTAAA